MDISPNPSPQQWNKSLGVLYLNTGSLKAIVASSEDCTRKVCKMWFLQRLVYDEDNKTGFKEAYSFVTFTTRQARDDLLKKGTVDYKGGREPRLRKVVKKKMGGQFFAPNSRDITSKSICLFASSFQKKEE